MKVQDININDPVKNKGGVVESKLPVKMEGLFITPMKTRPINIMCERCHKRLLELKQQATKLFVVYFLEKGRHGEKPDTAGFYKGRVLDNLKLPPQTSTDWVNSSHGNGHCNNCETTEEQLKVGAVNIVKDHENRLTTALKSVKSQRVASGYRSDSVLGPNKKSNHRSSDKISNLHHKSTENLKSNYVELASFGPPPPKPAFKTYNGHSQPMPIQPAHHGTHAGNHHHANHHGSHSNHGTNSSEHAYANLPNQYSAAPLATGGSQINANLNVNYSKPHESLDVKLASNVETPLHADQPVSTTDIPNRTITDLAPVPPKRSDSSRFSSRLKRKKESKSSTPSSTPEPNAQQAPANNNSFFAKASQMFRKRKKERPMTYAELMRLFAPPPPPSLLRAYHTEGNASDTGYTYNVKFGMRITPNPTNKESILSVDESKNTVLIANETLYFDYVHGPTSKQIDICNSMLSDVVPAILHGRSVVVVTFGKNSAGRQFSLIGSRDSTQCLGLVPTAVTWLNKLGEDDRSKCGPNTINLTSLRIDEQKSLSEFVSPASISKSEDLGKYLDKLTLTLPAREHPNDEALIINMTFSKSKSKKKSKDNYGMLTFIDVGTPIRKNDNASVLCWNWLQDVTQTTGNKYFESFVQLRHNLMQSKTHVVSLGHITHSPKDYQAIGITLNLATRLYMRHLPPQKRNELQRLKKEKEYSSATSTGEESADTVIYRPGLVSDGEGPPKSHLPERTKGDGQEKSPQFCSSSGKRAGRGGGLSDSEDRLRKAHLRSGYHSDTAAGSRRGAGYASDGGNYKSQSYTRQHHVPQSQPSTTQGASRPRQYALTDTEDLQRFTASPRARSKPYSDTENRAVGLEPAKRRNATKTAQANEDIRQKRVQKNQQQLKRYFELLRLKNQREVILQQSREMRGASTPPPPAEEAWDETKPAPPAPAAPENSDKENEDVKLRTRTRSESRNKGDNRRLYTIYDTEDDGAVLDQFLEDKPRRSRSGYKSDSGVKTNREKTEISREWLSKIKKKRMPAPGGKFIDYGVIGFNETPQVKEVKAKRVKSSLSEDELITRGHHQNCNLLNKDLRYSERRFDKNRSGYSTDAGSTHRSKPRSNNTGYQSDSGRHRHRRAPAEKQAPPAQQQQQEEPAAEVDLDVLLEQVHEVEQLVANKMQWRGAVADLDYFDQQIRLLERRNALIERLRRKQFELLSELKDTKNNLMSTDWKPDLTVDTTMNENSPGYLSALWKETSNLQVRVNTCKSKILVETSFM